MPASIDISVKAIGLEADITKQYNAVQAAINRKPISVKLNTSQFPLGRITSDVKDFDKSLGAATNRVIAFGLAAGIFSNISKGFENFIKSTINVEDAFARINVNLGQGADGLKRFSAQIFEIARNTGATFEETAKAAEELARQGLSAEETAKRLKDSLILARIAGLDTADAVKALTSAVNTFQKEGITTTDVVNRFAAVDTRFAVSSKDLSEAISRVGNSAQEAGVNFNQLLGIVTAVQQSTQRGGATIGNSLRTIFARISRPEALEQLQDLGIVTKDVQNNLLPGIQIIQNLANQYDKLSQGQKSFVAEQVGGVYQINILKAAVADLSKEYGTYAQVQKIANDAGDSAAQKNEKLNQTLKSLINSTENSLKELFASLGNQQVGSVFKTILSQLDGFRKALQSTDLGQFFGDSILKGISNVLTGPVFVGLLLSIGTTLSKIFENVGGNLQSALGLNVITEQRAQVQERINTLLSKATSAEQQQIASATSLLEKKEAILAIAQRITAQEEITTFQSAAQVSQFISPGSIPQFGAKVNPKLGRSAANGYIPSAVIKEAGAISKGVGGASAGAKPVVIPNFAFGNGKVGPVVANTDEYMVKNYALGADAILNPSMIKSAGLPQGAKKITNAAMGLIPNYAGGVENPGGVGNPFGAAWYKEALKRGRLTAEEEARFDKQLKAYRSIGTASGSVGEGVEKGLPNPNTSPNPTANFAKPSFSSRGAFQFGDLRQASGAPVKKQDIENLNKLFENIAKSGNIDAAGKFTTEIIDFSKTLNDTSEKKIFRKIATEINELDASIQRSKIPVIRGGGGATSEANALAVQAESFKGRSFQPSFDPTIVTNRQKEFSQDRFLSARFERGRTTAIERVFSQKSAGQEVTPAQEKLFQDVLREEAKKVAAKTLSPNASKGAVQEFVNQFIQSKNKQFEEAARIAGSGKGFFDKASKFLNKPTTTLGLAIAAPFAAGFIPEGRGGTGNGQLLGAASGALQGVGIGGAFGPIGIAVGAVAGALVGAISKASKSMEEFSSILQKQSDNQKKQLDEVEQYVSLQQQYNDAVKRGSNEEANLLSKKLNDSLKNASPEVLEKFDRTGGGNRELSTLLDQQREEFESDERKRKTEIAFKSISGIFTKDDPEGIKTAGRGLAARASEKGIDLNKRFSAIKNVNSDNEIVDAEKKLFKDLGLENEYVSIGSGGRNIFRAIGKGASDQKRAKDLSKNLAKNAPAIEQLEQLDVNAFSNKGDLTPFAQSGASSRFANQFTTKYQKADTRFNFFKALQSQGAFGTGAQGELALEKIPEFRASRAISQRGNLLETITSFLENKIPGFVGRGPNGAPLETGIRRSLANIASNPNNIEAKVLLERLDLADNTIKNLKANNETKNKLNINQNSVNGLQIDAHTTAFAGTNSLDAQRFKLTPEKIAADKERAKNYFAHIGERGNEDSAKSLIGNVPLKFDNAKPFSAPELPKEIKTFADSISDFNKANITASQKLSDALKNASDSFKNTRIESMNNFAITVQVAPDLTEVVTKAAMDEYAKYVETQFRQILGEVKGKPVPPAPIPAPQKNTSNPTQAFSFGAGYGALRL